ncbi:MAG TPA: hypothetical protein VFD04_17225, partial [Actinomycetes bacterium]|nr:hypothetical protein [Actinomycetes bacterium]
MGQLRQSLHERTPGAPRRGAARWPPSRAVRLALLAVALLGLVAVGSLREPLVDGSGTSRYPTALLETLILLAYVCLLAGAVLAIRVLLAGGGGGVRRPRSLLVAPLTVLLVVLAVWVAGRMGWLDVLRLLDPRSLAPQPPGGSSPGANAGTSGRDDPGWLSLLITGLLLLGVAAAVVLRSWLARRRRVPPPGPRRLAELLEESLADLEGETDPRRAVIAAWIRMERGLAAVGLPRRAAEAPLEYVARVLERAG